MAGAHTALQIPQLVGEELQVAVGAGPLQVVGVVQELLHLGLPPRLGEPGRVPGKGQKLPDQGRRGQFPLSRGFFKLAKNPPHRVLAEVLEALRWLLKTGVGGGQVLQGGSAYLPPEMAPLCRHLELLLTDMEDQTRQGDCIMLADLLEYELLPLVEQWSRLLLTMACG